MTQGNQKPSQLKLLFVGDVMLGRLVNRVLKGELPAYPWGDTLPLLHAVDARICNLECVLTDRGKPWTATPKVFHFRSDAKNIAVLKAAQMDALSLANNHVLDFDYDGLIHMLNTLKKGRIYYVGAGITHHEASAPAIWKVNGKTIGMLACTDNEPEWEATNEQPGVWYVPINHQAQQAQHLLEVVRTTKAAVDILIVSIHWGPNWGYAPPAEHISFAHALIDEGVDIVFGHSGHVVRGIEIYKEKPIMYCAGDFIDDYAVDEIERNDQSYIFVVEIDGERISRLLLYPTIIENFQALRAMSYERQAIVSNMQKLCTKLHTPTKWDEQKGCLILNLY